MLLARAITGSKKRGFEVYFKAMFKCTSKEALQKHTFEQV